MFNPFLFDGVSWDALSQCTFDRWQPKIGDPNIMGWVTVAAYLVTFLFCVAVFRRAAAGRTALRVFWLFLSVLMLFLAVNKQLDLQSFATATARCVAKLQGWYEDRRGFQFRAIIAMAIVALTVGGFFLWFLRRDLKRNAIALLGLTVVFGFVLIRAVGWHNFDELINMRVGGARMNWILELSGLVLISLNAILLLRFSHIEVPRRRRRRVKRHDAYRREH